MSSNQAQMEQVTQGLPSKSAMIRALAKAGYTRSEIAKFVGIRSQFVRNVLVDEARRAHGRTSANENSANEQAAGSEWATGSTAKLRLDSEGRATLPKPFRDALGLGEGSVLIASLEGDELHLLTIPAAVRRAQALVRQFVPEGVSLVDELLEDRRREVELEERNG